MPALASAVTTGHWTCPNCQFPHVPQAADRCGNCGWARGTSVAQVDPISKSLREITVARVTEHPTK
jgi:hypothetical protein